MFANGLAENIFTQIWEYLKNKYLVMQMGTYDNFSFNESAMITPTLVIVGMTIGIIVAGVFILLDKRVLGSFVRALLMDQCYTKETAKTLKELGFENNYFVRSELHKGRKLGRVVHCVEEEAYAQELQAKREAYEKENEGVQGAPPFVEVPYRPDWSSVHFYIPKEESYEADTRFEKKGTGVVSFLVLVFGSLIVMGLLIYLFPDIIQLLDNAINIIKG